MEKRHWVVQMKSGAKLFLTEKDHFRKLDDLKRAIQNSIDRGILLDNGGMIRAQHIEYLMPLDAAELAPNTSTSTSTMGAAKAKASK